jgi:serine/threonine protein kinase
MTNVILMKKLKNDANMIEKLDLIREAVSLNSFTHPNLIQLYGVCLDRNCEGDPKYIILEYMNTGDLLSYLRANRNTSVRGFHAYCLTSDNLKLMVDCE